MQKNSLKLPKTQTERIECELNLNAYTEKCNQTGEKIEEITAKINDLKTVINGDEKQNNGT